MNRIKYSVNKLIFLNENAVIIYALRKRLTRVY